MSKHGKRYFNALKKAPKKEVTLEEAVKFVKDNAGAKFDETVDVYFHLGKELTKGDTAVRGTVKLPNGSGKTVKVAVWYEPEIPNLGDSDSEDAWYYSLKHAAEEYNCKVEWIVDTQDAHFSNFIQKSLAGEVYADIMMCHSWNYVSLIQQGLILPTTEYVKNASDASFCLR